MIKIIFLMFFWWWGTYNKEIKLKFAFLFLFLIQIIGNWEQTKKCSLKKIVFVEKMKIKKYAGQGTSFLLRTNTFHRQLINYHRSAETICSTKGYWQNPKLCLPLRSPAGAFSRVLDALHFPATPALYTCLSFAKSITIY